MRPISSGLAFLSQKQTFIMVSTEFCGPCHPVVRYPHENSAFKTFVDSFPKPKSIRQNLNSGKYIFPKQTQSSIHFCHIPSFLNTTITGVLNHSKPVRFYLPPYIKTTSIFFFGVWKHKEYIKFMNHDISYVNYLSLPFLFFFSIVFVNYYKIIFNFPENFLWHSAQYLHSNSLLFMSVIL